jgi:hypothetical protein
MNERNIDNSWKESFRLWFLGKQSKEIYKKTITLNLIIVVVTLLVSILLYSESFSLYEHQISFLGSRRENPAGYLIFNIGFIIAGLIFIPHVFFLYQCLLPDIKILSQISILFLLLASIGLSFVGIFPSDFIYSTHMIAAVTAFGGIAFSMILMIFPFIKKILRNAEWPSIRIMLLFFCPLISIIVFTAIFVGVPVLEDFPNSILGEPPELWAICEWLIAITSMFWFFGMIYSSLYQK